MVCVRFFLVLSLCAVVLVNTSSGASSSKGNNVTKKPNPPETQKVCILRDTGTNGEKVCVCNSTYCDTILQPQKIKSPGYLYYTSNKDGLRFKQFNGNFGKVQDSDKGIENVEKNRTEQFERRIYVNSKKKYQTVIGWGGAFTDATGININSLNNATQKLLLQSYFSKEGLEYNVCRVPIGATDFGTHYYTYDDTPNPDPDLLNFTLAEEDFTLKIPHMKTAQNMSNNIIKFFGSPWAAPKWMKTNNDYTGDGFLKPEYYQSWAEYFVKFLQAYKDQGLDIWGVTTQNEASLAFLDFKDIATVGWNTMTLGDWVQNNLGPTVNASFPNTNIMVLDDQKLLLPWAVNSILNDPQTVAYVKGIAIHWYFGIVTPCVAMTKTHQNFPDLFILSTEACSGFQDSTGVLLGSWERGESYSTDIIDNMNCWVTGWVDWNMVLDLQGGPTFINNTVDSPIVVNSTAGEFYKQPMYYHLGHHSKYVPEGSVKIDLRTNLGYNISCVGYRRPDGGIAIVILNKNEEDIKVKIIDESVGETVLTVTRRSINTFLYWLK